MTKRHAAKKKICRVLRANLWGAPNNPVNTRPYRPGQHGKRVSKLSDYGRQLYAKQMLKNYYGEITEKQFLRTFKEANRRKGDTSENLVELLERRLASVVYHAKFAPTVFAARQLINHGHIQVNGQRVNIPSYMVKDGDVISVKEKSHQLPIVMEAVASTHRESPEYIEVDTKKLSAKFTFGPRLADIPYPVRMEPNLVVEYYSQ